MSNIEYCLQYLIEYAGKHTDKRKSHIFFNESFRKGTFLEVIPQESNEGHSPLEEGGKQLTLSP